MRYVFLSLIALWFVTTAFAQPAKGIPPMNLRLTLPPVIPAVPGREVNVYFDNVILCPVDWHGLLTVDVDCPRGKQEQERFTWTPTNDPKDLTTVPLSLKFSDREGNVVAEGKTVIHVYPPHAGQGKTATLLIIGDSLTNASVYPAELLALTAVDNEPKFTLIGTNVPNAATPQLRHEGYGGWTAQRFVTLWGPEPVQDGRRARSPFLFEKDGKPVLDFQKYCDEQNGGKGPDFITIFLGCNDNFGAKDDNLEATVDNFEKHLDLLIAELHRVRPDTKIGILTLVPPTVSQDAFGRDYGCGQTRWQYRKNQHRVVERTYARWGDQQARNVFIIPADVNLDAARNYPTVTAPANARTETAIARQSNSVHPAASGYKQIADMVYCWLKGQMAER